MPFKRVQDEETAGGPHALRAGRQLRLWLVQMVYVRLHIHTADLVDFILRTVHQARRGRLLSVWKKYILAKQLVNMSRQGVGWGLFRLLRVCVVCAALKPACCWITAATILTFDRSHWLTWLMMSHSDVNKLTRNGNESKRNSWVFITVKLLILCYAGLHF